MIRTFVTVVVVSLAAAAAVYAQAPQLVSYWPMDDGSGTTVSNNINPAYDGTFQSYYTTAPGVWSNTWPLPAWTSNAKFGAAALQFTATGAYTGTSSSNALAVVGCDEVTCPEVGAVGNLTNATISWWVNWQGTQIPWAETASSPTVGIGIYGPMLGYNAPGTYSDTTIGWDVGINTAPGATAGNGTPTSDPNTMAGLRLLPGTSVTADNYWPGYTGFGTANAYNTIGMPNNGTLPSGGSFTSPGDNTWQNIVLTVSGTNWSLYMDGTYLGTTSGSAGILPGVATSGSTSWPLGIGGLAENIRGAEAAGGCNAILDDMGAFNSALDGGVTANGNGGYTPNNIGLVDAIYNLGVSSLDYNLGEVNQLFTVYGDQSTTGSTVGGLNWAYATGLSGGLGRLQNVNGTYYVQLDSNGGGVEAVGAPVHNPGQVIAGDPVVDINDLTIVLSNFGSTGCTWSQGCMDGDPTGTVDINDLTIVLANFGTTYGTSSGIKAVPEPTCVVLLGIGAACLFAFAWRRRTT